MDMRFGFILIAAYAAMWLSTPAQAAQALGYCGTPYDTAVTAAYPIRGTWMFHRSGCSWQTALEDFHRIGGTTVLNFAPRMERHADPATVAVGCNTSTGLSCVQQAIQDIGVARIRNWLSYNFNEHYGAAIACPAGLDRKIEAVVGGTPKVFWRIVLPHDGQPACDYSSGSFDVLFAQYDKDVIESTSAMLTVADNLGMQAYLGAPAFPVVAGKEWMIDNEMLASHRDWARRVYTDWRTRHSSHPSFRGAYQPYELLLGSTYTAPYTEYGLDAAALRAQVPGGQYVISPYLFLFKNGTSNTRSITQTVDGFVRLANAGVDVIAPQDGRGTGKAAYYWPAQATQAVGDVDPMLGRYQLIDPARTFSEQFSASVRDAFVALRKAQRELSKNGREVSLWANVEAFEEDTESADYVNCSYSPLSRTTKVRMDRALTFVAGRVDRVISFMYDPLFTCAGRFGAPLGQAIAADHDRPLIADVFYWDTPAKGVAINGHGIASVTEFQLTWYNANWQLQTRRVAPGWVNVGGAGNGLDSVWVPFQRSDMAPNFYLHVKGIKSTPSGIKETAETFSMKY